MTCFTFKHRRSLAAFLLWMSVGVSCRPGSETKSSFARPDVAGILEFTSHQTQMSQRPLWRTGDLALVSLGDGPESSLATTSKTLVMVSFWAESELARQLAQSPRTLLYRAAPAPGQGHALVEIQSPAELDEWALAAHQSHYFGCGNLEVISGIPLTQSSEVAAALYQETVTLPEVTTMLAKVDASRIRTSIASLEALGTRYHTTATGLTTPATVKGMFEQAGAGIPGFSVTLFDHSSKGKTTQSSVIAAIPGSDDDGTTVIFGSHLDSINRAGAGSPAPGADDNASGVATLVEAVRVLAASGATFKRRVEFHAYAAEEVGLVGSADIAQTYANAGRKVAAMFQVDMNAYAADASSKTIYLVATDTSAVLRRSLKDLLTNYLGGDFEEMELSGGTSDHKSWMNRGYPAVFPFEHPHQYNKALHTDSDTSATANNAGLSGRFAQLALAFASHQAGLKNAADSYTAAIAAGVVSGSVTEDLALAIVNVAGSNAGLGSWLASDGYFQVGVGAAPEVKTVEYCTVSSADSPCTSDLYAAEPATGGAAASGRSLFLDAEALALSGDPLLRLSGYDAANKKIAARTVRLRKK